MLAAGGVLRLADDGIRDSQGYLMSSDVEFTSPGYAATPRTSSSAAARTRSTCPERWLGTVKVEVDARHPDQVFVGIARTSDVTRTSPASPTRPSRTRPAPTAARTCGTCRRGAARVDPAQATFWKASSGSRAARPTLTWEPRAGDWTLVVMNRNGSAAVAADVAVGADIPVLGDVAVALLVAGGVLLVVSLALVVAALRRVPTRS